MPCNAKPIMIDSHAHLDYTELFNDLDGVLARAAEAGVSHIITIGVKLTTSDRPKALAEAYDNQLKTDGADMKNIGGRAAGSITAAQFLQRFVNKVPWAHLDIAGVTWSSKDAPTVPKGATAFGVRLLDKFVADNYEK